MLVLEIIGILSAASSVATGAYKLVVSVRNNKYAANFARINELNAHQRGKFTEIVIPKKFAVAGHTHGDSAASRSAGSSACAAYALANNRIPFYLSMSASDQRADREGERTMHWAKDFNAEPRTDQPGPNSMLVMIDVDEHIEDLPGLLHHHNLPTIMYTFQPSAAAGCFKDYRYTFDKDNNVVYSVAGGGEYVHKVWNYGPDTLVMRKKLFSLTYAKSIFTVEKRYVDENHQIVLLTPLAKFGLLGCILSYNVSGTDLERLKPVTKDFIRLEVARSKVGDNEYEHKSTTARVGTYNAAVVDIVDDNAIAAVARSSSEKLNLFQIKSAIPKIEHAAAVTLLEYHREKRTEIAPRVVVPTDAVNNYTFNPTPFIDEKPSVTPFMAPIIPECYAPTVSVENEQAMIKERITKLKKEPDSLGEKEMKYAFEFCELLKKELGILEPHDEEAVASKLNRPSQRKITEEASLCDVLPDVIKSFMKKEAYQKTGAPRPIATINGKVKFEYSAFTYAVSEALKKTSWYAFGRTPKKIAERVSAICQIAKHVINTDLSRFDGRVNRSSRQLEEMIMTTLFPKKYHKKMLELMRKQYGQKGVTRLGVKYKNGYNRQSGSPETAILNTILNVFMAYVCFRESGCEPDEAYAKLGVYGGDDGVTPDVDAKLYTEVCGRFGHVLEAEVILRGKGGVSFLSRMYSPSVWFGSTNSCADIARAASKMHVSVSNNISALDKLFEKCYALSLTDSETPIIGPFVKRVVELSGKGASEYKNILDIWNSETPIEEQYPNADHDSWMHTILVGQKLDGFDDVRYRTWLSSCTELSQLLCCPEFIDKKEIKPIDVPVKVNGDLLKPVNKAPVEADVKVGEHFYAPPKSTDGLDLGDAPANKPSPHSNTTANSAEPYAKSSYADGSRKYPPRNKMSATAKPSPTVPSAPACGVSGVSTQKKVLGDNELEHKYADAARKHFTKGSKRAKYVPISYKGSEGTNTNPTPSTVGGRVDSLHIRYPPSSTPTVLSQINGNNGSATNTDDHKPRAAPNLHPYVMTQGEAYAAQIGELGMAIGDLVPDEVYDMVADATDPREEGKTDYVKPIADYIMSWIRPEVVPQPPLVGVELNPGPPKSATPPNPGLQKIKQDLAEAKKTEQQLLHKIKETNNKIANAKSKGARPNRQGPFSDLVGAPTAMSRRFTGLVPKFKRNSQDAMTIAHTELISLVTGTSSFTSTTHSMQPGSSVFQWLSTQVNGWEKYRWKKLIAHYITRTGTSTPGSLMMVADYDAADQAPATQIAASAYFGVADDAPWKENSMRFDMRRSKELFIRTGALAANLDIKTYDFANLFICTSDGTAVSWGKVYIEYEIELYNAQVLDAPNTGGIVTGLTSMTGAAPYGTAPVVTNGTFVTGVTNGSVVSLQNLIVGREYYYTFHVIGTTITAITTTNAGLTNKTTVANDLINAAATFATDSNTFLATATTGTITTVVTAATVTSSTFVFSAVSNAGAV